MIEEIGGTNGTLDSTHWRSDIAIMPDLPSIEAGESDESYLRRRAGEERQQVAATSCMVRSVHEELAEEYEQRLEEAAAVTASLEALVAQTA